MRDCYYKKYEPIFGAWHIISELGSGVEGHLYRISREDALGNVYYSALKAITVPAGGEEELNALIAGGMSREEAERYFDGILESTVHEFSILEKLKGNSNIVSYEDHEIIRREDSIGWDILIRLEELTPLITHAIYHTMDEAEIIRMGTDLCRGLVLCGKYGIVHRDIKPENIFISPSGSYKLGDFGIARIVEETTKSLSRKGTYAYMAPEVYWGQNYDHRVDIYALGMVMYRYLNDGRMPFMPEYPAPAGYQDEGSSFTRRIGGEKIPAPRNGSEELKAAVLKACAYDMDDRYADAEEMRAALESLGSGERIKVLAADTPETGTETDTKGKSKGRKKFKIAAAILALCVAAAGGVYAAIPKEVEDIEISGIEDGAEIYIDEDVTPVYTVLPDWFSEEPVTFATNNAEVLSVNESGKLHAGIPGEAVLTVRAKEYSEDVRVKVVPKVTAINGIDDTISLTTGNTLKLEPVLEPEKFASEPVTYSTADESIASVSEEGNITAVSAGETELIISAGGTQIRSKIVVSNPIVYRSRSSTKKSSGSSKKSSGSGKASNGYFDSSDDETF